MTDSPAFDVLAPAYDLQFTTSLVGQEQRRITRKWLSRILAGKEKLDIVEINCGTGDDALWLAGMSHHVVATDQSPAMIEKAKQKISKHLPEFITCAFDHIGDQFKGQQFDLIFSNFAGLNCVSPEALKKLGEQLHTLLKPGGYFAAVIFGKNCLWETVYYLSKAQAKNAFRRRTNEEVLVKLDETTLQPVYYYSTKQFTRILKSFKKTETRPVGLFVPPSYLEGAMKKHPRFFRRLVKMEDNFGGWSAAASLADHTYMLFKKEKK
jgi:ubiquinone/menaquinone biosynthesis C-methylase UbiE